MKLVILSDTHGLLRPAVQARLEGADAILHAGDVNTPAVVEALRGYAPLYIVRGNNDKDWAADLRGRGQAPSYIPENGGKFFRQRFQPGAG